MAGLTPGFGRGGPRGSGAWPRVRSLLVLWRPEVMLLAVAAFPWLDWVARRTLGGFGPAWDDAFLILSIAVLLWCVIVLRRWELWTVPIALPTLLALAAAIGSVVVRDVPGDVALFALRVLFQPLLFYFLGFLFPKNKRWVQWAVAVFVLASVALALHGLYQYVTHAPMPARWVDVRETDIGTRAYSIIENPNGLGAFLLMGTLVSLSLALARGLRRLHTAAHGRGVRRPTGRGGGDVQPGRLARSGGGDPGAPHHGLPALPGAARRRRRGGLVRGAAGRSSTG